VGGGIVVSQHAVAGRRKHLAVAHDHGAERPAGSVDHARFAHQLDRLRHVTTVLIRQRSGRCRLGIRNGRPCRQHRRAERGSPGCEEIPSMNDGRRREQRFERRRRLNGWLLHVVGSG
jgi:hypothetical protein